MTDVPPPAPPPPAPPPPPGHWVPPPGWVPPPPPAGWVPPPPVIVESPSPVRKPLLTLLAVAAFVGLGGWSTWKTIDAFIGAQRQVDSLVRGPIPVATLELEEDDRETIHIEADGMSDDDAQGDRLTSMALSATVTVRGPDERLVPIERVFGESTYGFGHEGVVYGRIAVPADGLYRIEVRGFDAPGEVAVGDVSFGSMAVDAVVGIGGFIVAMFIGAAFWTRRIKR